MIVSNRQIMDIKDLTNEEIIAIYLNHYRYSKQSVNTRKHNLTYFFSKKYFGFPGHTFEISKRDLFEYFDYLNNLETISIITKKIKWTILSSFLEFCMEYFDDFIIIIPKKTITWKTIHKEPNSNKHVIISKKNIEILLTHFKKYDYKYYLIFRILIESGMRKGELININYDNVNIEKRYIETFGKSGRKVYYISKKLSLLLENYIKERVKLPINTKALFISSYKKRFSNRPFNTMLKTQLKKLGIIDNISCHTFRRSLNTYRKLMGCQLEDRKILLNHKTSEVNLDSYVILNYKQFIELFDKWNPYKKLKF